ncbi:MAG: DNA-processing protein DprA [Myxococcota bacterium]
MLERQGIGRVFRNHRGYPDHLVDTLTVAKAPPVLTFKGSLELLQTPCTVISGSRRASPEGLACARAVAESLAKKGVVIATGLARGVDREAMNAALKAGGRVIGVSAQGILKTAERWRREVGQGRLTVVSPFEPSALWSARQAMQRNTVLAGLSRVLVVADCVAPGGTSNQVETHRRLGFPVFLRRGRGEGEMVAELAEREGVKAFWWRAEEPTPIAPFVDSELHQHPTTNNTQTSRELEADAPELGA